MLWRLQVRNAIWEFTIWFSTINYSHLYGHAGCSSSYGSLCNEACCTLISAPTWGKWVWLFPLGDEYQDTSVFKLYSVISSLSVQYQYIYISYTRLQWKSTKQLVASKATMNIKYWPHFLQRHLSMIAFSTTLFAGRSFALTDMLTTIIRDLEDHSSAWSMTSRSMTSSEISRAFKRLSLCAHHIHVLLWYRKFALSKILWA